MSNPQISVMAIVLKPENVAQFAFFMRGEKVMLDADLAMLYGVEALPSHSADIESESLSSTRPTCFDRPREARRDPLFPR
jgi:hypothetical protein